MLDRNSLYDNVWKILAESFGDSDETDYLTDRICDVVIEWVPKKGDLWMTEPDGKLYVNEGWELVTLEPRT